MAGLLVGCGVGGVVGVVGNVVVGDGAVACVLLALVVLLMESALWLLLVVVLVVWLFYGVSVVGVVVGGVGVDDAIWFCCCGCGWCRCWWC